MAKVALVVGYGTDSTPVDYWLMKNSWGDQGYIKIANNGDGESSLVGHREVSWKFQGSFRKLQGSFREVTRFQGSFREASGKAGKSCLGGGMGQV